MPAQHLLPHSSSKKPLQCFQHLLAAEFATSLAAALLTLLSLILWTQRFPLRQLQGVFMDFMVFLSCSQIWSWVLLSGHEKKTTARSFSFACSWVPDTTRVPSLGTAGRQSLQSPKASQSNRVNWGPVLKGEGLKYRDLGCQPSQLHSTSFNFTAAPKRASPRADRISLRHLIHLSTTCNF